MSSAVGAGVSSTGPLSGQKQRSGPNFTMLQGGQLVVQCVSGVSFDIMQDKTGSDPTIVSGASNGTSIASGKLGTNANYYIANPKNASTSFAVVLNQA